MEERYRIRQWIKNHKTELVLGGICFGALAFTIWGVQSQKTMQAQWLSLSKVSNQPTFPVAGSVTKAAVTVPSRQIAEVIAEAAPSANSISFEVSRHLRNLPEGWHASPDKVAEALKNGIVLSDGQTWVESYTKGNLVA